MRLIEDNLRRRGIEVLARSFVRTKWWKNRPFLKAMASSDLVLINGEGTLHHGVRHAEHLLQVVDHEARGTTPVALVNAVYQENPRHWRRYLDKTAFISPRDRWSAEELNAITGRPVVHVPDLSLSAGAIPAEKDQIILHARTIGDSAVGETRRDLIELARADPDATFLPVVSTLKSSKPEYRQPIRALREADIRLRTGLFRLFNRRSIICADEPAYVRSLRQSRLHVDGRFHAICFALMTQTPFLALRSNTWKIEALMEEFGLGKHRLVRSQDLEELLRHDSHLSFSAEEAALIADGLASSKQRAARMFDHVASLAKGAQTSLIETALHD